ncbi:phosphotransferase family protein [Parerythrobacter lacustris]|uniref:Phosphotransferase family protein n=1 Tax=Parerythrobacter lacustris TaxID=2969984 RepID=A0ABT1XNZ7_9SPHN|nr:phosphotransferase family protein [Parerythrobacter lacustris]MCR2832964.1 phosphotransferase family protein [Parerythrobacter lacustris]
MGEMTQDDLREGLVRAMARAGVGEPSALHRLTGGATMESWRFTAGGEDYVLRRAPSLAFMEGRPFGHATEAAVIRAAHGAGVTAPEVVTVLEDSDGIGSGFVMRALPGTPDPKAILAMEQPDRILAEVARDLARIHSLGREDVPPEIPELDYRDGIENLRQQFEEAGGDRPMIALGLRWLMDHVPDRVESVLGHGDYRLGNILCEDSHLTGVLDWELAHFGDPHEDLAFGCMPVWRFARYDRPALGLGSLEDYFAVYEAESGRTVDPARFRFWSVYRTVWWALGCLRMADFWRRGEDRMLERVVISRRTSEQELDLLLLLEEDAPEAERNRAIDDPMEMNPALHGEAQMDEIVIAVSEWLSSIKHKLEGHDRFQLAVARNALGIVEREHRHFTIHDDRSAALKVLRGEMNLRTPGFLAECRRGVWSKLREDSPKYPSLQAALAQWPMEEEE